MKLLKWLTRHFINAATPRADVRVREDFTSFGNAIDPEWHSGWSPGDSGAFETRRHVGQSAEGFHAGVEVSRRICDRVVWGEAHATPEKAREAARELECKRWEEIERCPEIGRAPGGRRSRP